MNIPKDENIAIEYVNDNVTAFKMHHPAFGVCRFARLSGGNLNLTGSDIQHNQTIELVIEHATGYRHNTECDSYMGDGRIACVRMSETQFATLISSLNCGSGVPCTVEFTERDGYIPQIKSTLDKKKLFSDEFENNINKAMSRANEQINKLQESIDSKKTFTASDKKDMLNALHMISMEISGNLDFCSRQFNEHMDNITTDAKGEIEAYVQNKMMKIMEKAIIDNQNEFLNTPTDLVSIEEKNN